MLQLRVGRMSPALMSPALMSNDGVKVVGAPWFSEIRRRDAPCRAGSVQ
jgi:hypothetical protein